MEESAWIQISTQEYKMRFIFVIWVFILVLSNRIYSKENPNIIIIYTDDQGYGDSSLLNPNSKFQTPNIDRIGKEGITFTDAHSPDTVCTPSRYGLLTCLLYTSDAADE